MDALFAEYKKELEALGLTSKEDLQHLVKPLLKHAIRLTVLPPEDSPKDVAMRSHFGGQPYFEKGESWPTTADGENLAFVFQVVQSPELSWPNEIAVIQFYYHWEEGPWETDEDGWLVKTYASVSKERLAYVEKPASLDPSPYCPILPVPVLSLPDWEGLASFAPQAEKLSCILNTKEPWKAYTQVVEELIGEQDYHSQIGGYPRWIQGEDTPETEGGQAMELLFQIDSEANAGITWADSGMIYVFYSEEVNHPVFMLQSL